jgi:hypothetical protein
VISFRESLNTFAEADSTMWHCNSSSTVNFRGGTTHELFKTRVLPKEFKKIKPMACKRVKRRSLNGIDGELNIENMYSRKPYTMMSPKLKSHNVINLQIDVSFSAKIQSYDIDQFTEQVLIAVQTLMLSGYAVGLKLVNEADKVDKNKKITNIGEFVIKRPEEKLSIQDIARTLNTNYYRSI